LKPKGVVSSKIFKQKSQLFTVTANLKDVKGKPGVSV